MASSDTRAPSFALTDSADGSGSLDTSAADTRPTMRRRLRLLIPLLLVAALTGGLLFVFTVDKDEPATMLGAAGAVDGGLARINGIIPLETDGWSAPVSVSELERPVTEGGHRVRVLLELTALEGQGVEFAAEDYVLDGLGTGTPGVLWSSPSSENVAQGGTINATLVFEIPNRALALVLEGPDGLRLSLGTEHHTS
ncbi:hypothetical protein [Arthrobacter tumbae]|uniref:hypothetical protein n=1 Tax=Arthrobacter tumbae TaxID=163874 RepID=UPI001EF7B0FD|nr:hypothetical protein [Arthrobacter tumbae]MBM7779952.1 hypothetical protein [Arthrobacter tumbae]